MAKILVAAVVVLALVAGVGYWFWGRDIMASEGDKYLAGVTVSSVITRVERDGFTCIRGSKIVQCENKEAVKGADLAISIHFVGEAEVGMLEASGGTEAYSNDEAEPEDLRGFFEMAAGLPLRGAEAGRAGTWAGDHVGESGKATFGDVAYRFSGSQMLLTMTPA